MNKFTLLYKNAQGGKTSDAIEFIKSNKEYFCIYVTINNTPLLEQTINRISNTLGENSIIRLE